MEISLIGHTYDVQKTSITWDENAKFRDAGTKYIHVVARIAEPFLHAQVPCVCRHVKSRSRKVPAMTDK